MECVVLHCAADDTETVALCAGRVVGDNQLCDKHNVTAFSVHSVVEITACIQSKL